MTCKKSSGLSPKIIQQIELKISGIDEIYHDKTDVVIILNLDLLYINSSFLERKNTTKEDLLNLIQSNIKISKQFGIETEIHS
jgi:hypothetical protein